MTVDALPMEVQLEEINGSLLRLRRRLDELEGQLGVQGLVGGETPNLQSGRIGFGSAADGRPIGRLDSYGIQIKKASNPIAGTPGFVALFWLPELAEEPGFSANRAYTDAYANSTETVAALTAVNSSSAVDGTGGYVAAVFPTALATGAQYVLIRPTLLLDPQTADPTVLSDGMAWYRSDTDKFKGRANGVTQNFAFESYVDTNAFPTLSILRAYKDADQEVTNTTLDGDSELIVSLAATASYHFRAVIFFLNDGAAEGYKCALSGTVGVGDLKAQISIYDDTTNSLAAFARVTALGSSVGAGLSSGSNFAVIEGTIESTTAGTFFIQFAQNAAGINAGVHHEIGSGWIVTRLE